MGDHAISKDTNLSEWRDFHRTRTLLFKKRQLLKSGDAVFTMGSCFAGEIRHALKRRGFTLYPDYPGIHFDRSLVAVDLLPEDKLMEHYDTFVMRQEFESAFDLWPDRCDGIWPVQGNRVNHGLGVDLLYQEPSRRRVFGVTPEALAEVSAAITAAVRNGIERAALIILTLGLTEVWRHKRTSRFICCSPDSSDGSGLGHATFHQSTFAENHTNLRAMLDMLFERYPNKQVLLTVSPVPLAKTYSDMDVGTANMESKSILRAVAGQISREYENVTYFPSYEMATILNIPVYKEDGRHVLAEFADLVVQAFTMAHIQS